MTDTPRDPAPAVSRALKILTALEQSEGVPLTLSELARVVGIAKSSAANLCTSLEDGGMIERDARGYRLGRRTAELGGAFAMQFNQVREFFAICAASEDLHREVVQIAMLDGSDMLYLARHEGTGAHRLGTPLGSRLPVTQSGTGRALLSALGGEELDEVLAGATFDRITPHSVRSRRDLLPLLAEARERGYTVDRGSSFDGITGVAVPLPAWSPSDPRLAMGAALPSDGATDERIARVGAALIEAAHLLTNPLAVRA
ncbi:IclR family transcriptional regulator [Microbacterium indicum]|uniref:IclR family transcriptional regulator n=1 Tax=Microbacterium indicum TaxID=358100 RepID=UPI0003FF1D30|nr:IclR family transcriptional regulator [Microbacterium indicum]